MDDYRNGPGHGYPDIFQLRCGRRESSLPAVGGIFRSGNRDRRNARALLGGCKLMARRWVVLTADRGSIAVNHIVEYTEWDGRVALSDEVIYTDPVDLDGNPVDMLWKIGGNVTLAAGVYTYSQYAAETTLIERQRGQIFDAYNWWRIFGRTGHWAGIRRGVTQEIVEGQPRVDVRQVPLDSTDKWAYHLVALMDHAINGTWPVSGAFSAVALQAALDHAEDIFRNWGPRWYLAQIKDSDKSPTADADSYAGMVLDAGQNIYMDVFSILGVSQEISGDWDPMGVALRAGFNPEHRNLGN